MKVKILTLEEYNKFSTDRSDLDILNDFAILLATNNFIAVDMGDETYKILKYPVVQSLTNEEQQEKLNIYVSKEELEKFIFLHDF